LISFILWVFTIVGGIVCCMAVARVCVAIVAKSALKKWQVRSWWRTLFDQPPKPLDMPDIPTADPETSEPAPVDISPYRTQHMHIIGGTGAGKTTFLEHRILNDFDDPIEPAVVVVDSQTALIQRLAHIEAFSPHHSDERILDQRVIIVDPRDAPAMNPFAIDRKRLERYDQETRYQVEQGVIQTFDYLFDYVIGSELTTRQTALFRHTARLMLSLPETMGRNATILDVLKFFENPDPYIHAIETLPELAQQFFNTAFFDREKSRAFRQTREQVAYRLYALLENTMLAKILTAETNELDLFNRLNQSCIFLVDTAQEYLRDASPIFGSFFICNLLQVIEERAAPRVRRKRCHVYIDEAQEYFNDADTVIERMLSEARKQNVGLTFAHHFKRQCTERLWSALMANTSIKLAGGISAEDANALARDFRCDPRDLLSLKEHTWACFIRGRSNPVAIDDGPSPLSHVPRMTDGEYRELRAANRERLQSRPSDVPPEPPAPATTEPTTSETVESVQPVPDPSEASTEWRPRMD
jgi:hypothetical protein